jgi:cell wall-associated NlpC family hydrolase
VKLRSGTRPPGRRYTRYTLGGVAAGAVIALVAVLLGGAGSSSSTHRSTAGAPAARGSSLAASGPGKATGAAAPARRGRPVVGGASVAGTAGGGAAAELPDPEAAQSFPAPASVHHAAARTPAAAAATARIAPGAPSDAEVRRELAQMNAALKSQGQSQQAPAGGGSLGGNGTFKPPPGVPAIVARVIAGGNAIADFPYVFGGGHASFVDSAYDCSGSVSYALAAGGLIGAPVTSGELESWGVPGPGRWITVEANAGHTYMYVAGMRFDTSGRSGVFGSRWQPAQRSNAGFVTRHWPGL